MPRDRGTKEHFMATAFPWSGLGPGRPVKQLAGTLFVNLTKGRVARIDLMTRGHSGQYEGLQVRILKSDEGEIDRLKFWFEDHLTYQPGPDEGTCYGGLMVVAHVKWDWYIDKPKKTLPVVAAIGKYLDVFEEGDR